jgi:hypothetical protein
VGGRIAGRRAELVACGRGAETALPPERYLSLNATEQLDRQGIQAPSPFEFEVRHRLLFTFTARHPYG